MHFLGEGDLPVEVADEEAASGRAGSLIMTALAVAVAGGWACLAWSFGIF